MRLAWTDRALLRVEETTRYIATDDPAAAMHWASELFDLVEPVSVWLNRGEASAAEGTTADYVVRTLDEVVSIAPAGEHLAGAAT